MLRNRQVNVGTDTILECKAPESRDIPSKLIIWWEKDGKKIIIDDSHYILRENSLHIINITAHDAGQYNCIVKSEVGRRRTRNLVATINGTKFIIIIFFIYYNFKMICLVEKPSLTRKPESSSYLLNSKVELVCEAKGLPEPKVEWFKENGKEAVLKYLRKIKTFENLIFNEFFEIFLKTRKCFCY